MVVTNVASTMTVAVELKKGGGLAIVEEDRDWRWLLDLSELGTRRRVPTCPWSGNPPEAGDTTSRVPAQGDGYSKGRHTGPGRRHTEGRPPESASTTRCWCFLLSLGLPGGS